MSSVKKQLFEQLAQIAQAIASPQRLELLDYLAQAERSVEELSNLSGLSVANTSRHLQILKQNALVEVRKDGNKRLYLLAGDDVVTLVASLRNTAETHLAQVENLVDSYLTKKDQLDPVSADELMEMSRNGEIIVLDVRPEKEYQQGHIPSAINIPPEDLSKRLVELDDSKTIVAYCRGPYCLYSFDAVEALQKKGIHARRLVDGFPEWKASGRPVTSEN
ncbi:metalloregulator ArsR/SmtB family transcription factor [Thiomicrorhabdus sp. ZW0627]|uniref:ArsR/SmtB family transcription factor n=1 Tax=Thiomicrorhabdus sp. ZW0627 TaxID=3039774 RepID=UPI0024371F3E|nr:metalloregulator ArsR/SmtB family transcription factor [Thiomicrorhabdus sp. ZW0627]MDG6774190.1 metalloregulator ArsR/SmtB family transcription factor [Thiomicrorhabdus sp. ZW0627]